MSGYEKEVDRLGRVVIPIEYRKKLGISPNSKVLFSFGRGVISISHARAVCAICSEAVESEREIRVCDRCVRLIKEKF